MLPAIPALGWSSMNATSVSSACSFTIVSAFNSSTYSGGSSDSSAGRITALLPPVNPRLG